MLPVLGALILQAAYGAVDLLVVGRFGSTSGLSAVSTGSQVLNLVTFLVTQLAMGVTVLIARYLGERCPEQIGAVIGGAAVVFALVSALLFAVPVGLARPIAVVMQAPAEAVTLTASYVRICDGGLLPTEDDDDVQCLSGPPESGSALVNRGYQFQQETLQLHWRVSCLYVPICYSIDLSDSAMLMRRRRKYITKSTIAANSTVSNSEYTTLIGAMRTSKAIMSTLICDMT